MSLNPETLPSEVTAESLYAGIYESNTDLTGVDVKDYLGKLKVTFNASAAADDNQAALAVLQESAESNANFTDLNITLANIAANGAATFASAAVDTRATKRYVRAHVTSANGNGRAISITINGKKQVSA